VVTVDFEAEALLTIEEVEGVNAAFEDAVSVPMEMDAPISRQPPSRPMADVGGGGPSLTSLAEDRNETLAELLDEIEAAGGLGGGGGGGGGGMGGDIVGGLGLAQLGAAGSAGFGLDMLMEQGTTGSDEPLGPVADLLMDADTEGEAVTNTRKRLFGQTEPPINASALGDDMATAFNDAADFPDLPDLSATEWPDLPDLSSSVDWPNIPDPGGPAYWPDIPEPEDIGLEVPPAVEDLLGGGSSSSRPDGVSNARVPGGFDGSGSGSPGGGALDVTVSDFRVDPPKPQEIERELESFVKDLIEDKLEREFPG
jgi:hypothetical protein